ncbi:MAG: rhomboid family intramembrane serine protease [Bacteroidales bacterium]|nr:rhomboid family intramembrane serine protease [Bacteroidales bacterium]MBN2820469.1 rhomboid family intramembrane serine protease [Bacteroidales bacterium]
MNYYSGTNRNFLSNLPQVTRFLIIANVAFFALNFLMQGRINYWLALYSPNTGLFKSYQLISHMFLHAGFFHIFMNIFFGVYMFGRMLESYIGSQRFFILYFVSGLGAAGLQLLVYHIMGVQGAMVGASGAVYGILAAFAYLFPNVELMVFPFPVPVKAKYLIPGFLVLSVYQGLSNNPGDNVAHFAHIGGAVIGFIITLFWKKNQFRQY